MTDLVPQSESKVNEKWFIVGMAFLQGIALLLIWLWVDQLANARQYFNVILPLYVLAISFPLSMMLLASQPRKLAFSLVGTFSVIAAFCAMYIGDVSYMHGLASYNSDGFIWQFGFCMLVAWFIAVTFIEHYCQYQHWFNRYASLYDFSWRNAVKLITAGIFTGLFWAALLMLAGLFKVLGITLFQKIIEDVYFIYPATAVAFGLGISLYSAKQEALSEFKRAILHVLGWLLPLVSLILLAFIITLPFKGLGALWGTGYATSLMLGLLALMVFLLNTAYQDGKSIQYPTWLLKLANVGVMTMPIYALLCIYALYLRIAQYGWTDDRVWAASLTFIITIYSLGYAYAAFQSFKSDASKTNTNWMQAIRPINVMTAIFLLVTIGLLYSPILSPMRIGVQSQMARLNNGKVAADVFDYSYLRFSGGKYGDTALRKLLADTASPQASTIKPLVEATLKMDYRYATATVNAANTIATQEALQARFTVYPKGAQVDKSFFDALFLEYKTNKIYLRCLHNDMATAMNDAKSQPNSKNCQVLAIDLNQDKLAEVVVLNQNDGIVYSKEAAGWLKTGWHKVATINLECCDEAAKTAALEVGKISTVTPAWQDLKIGDKTYQVKKL